MIELHELRVDEALVRFIEREAMPGTGVDADAFWQGFAALVHDLAPHNRALLAERDRLQRELDGWHRASGAGARPARLSRVRRRGVRADGARRDAQNAGEPNYRPMAPDPANSHAFGAARALVLEGAAQPSGHTEPLHRYRLAFKQRPNAGDAAL